RREVEPVIASRKDPEQALKSAEKTEEYTEASGGSSVSSDGDADPLDQLKALRKHAQQILKEV
ncbi:MAG: hypothetical protein LBF32_02655, partial [Streptococcaceae bacterium]|nr:hypothetical protein [Streptococcaceae bacterium]